MENKYLKAALFYATKYHWAVFPVSEQTKKPLTPHGCKDAKKDPGAIRAWWKKYPTAAIGIATGSASGLIVIDEDIDEDKDLNGYQEVSRWERENGDLPETVRAITGRGGAHMYYHYAGDDISNRAGILEGVDVRGEGGYVIAPPSRHPNGTEYQWEIPPNEIELAEADDIVMRFLSIGKDGARESHDFTVPETIGPGERNDTLFRIACSLQAQGYPDDAIRASVGAINRGICSEPLEDDEVDVILSSALSYRKGELKALGGADGWREPIIAKRLDKDGNETESPAQTVDNAHEAIAYDRELYKRIQFNEMAYAPYVFGNLPWQAGKGWREWTNSDDAQLVRYIEKKYGLKNHEKISLGFETVVSEHRFNPVKGMLEQAHEIWDGGKHVENLLPAMLGAEKNEYTTAVMRVFMMGAVHRIFSPGCKFDYMLVLVGEQGKGKSTFLRCLAVDDSLFSDNFNSLDGDKAFEKLRGMWIVEMAELQATKRAKDVESIKSFITSRVDTYRAPYNRRTEQRPRMCVLAGTSNPVDFLTDKTGNRRFLPITCNIHEPTFDLLADEQETRMEMMQAWGEIMDEYLRVGQKPRLVLPKRLQESAIRAQEAYLEEDPYIGIIQEWLDTSGKDRVCVAMIWKEALGHLYDDPKRQDVNRIHEILKNNVSGWKGIGKQRCGSYGVQKCYEPLKQPIIVKNVADKK